MNNLRSLLMLFLAAIPSAAFANAGIPMLMLAWPVLWLAFVPVVALEAAHLARSLGQPFANIVAPVAVANLWSTLAGVPIAWAALLAVEAVVGVSVASLPEHITNSQALRVAAFPLMTAWIMGSSELEVKAAFVLLMVAFCVVSAEVELRVLAKRLAPVTSQQLRSIVYTFNVASYALLTAIAVIAFVLTS